ncbi:MAG: pentapeptide repeat-containing protein, partial [Paraglaciecola sp.]|nr:pentapeptide repeat-containing protein [Paraglaciecola sp.]
MSAFETAQALITHVCSGKTIEHDLISKLVLIDANLQGATFKRLTIDKVNFDSANLSHSNFTDVVFNQVNLSNVNFSNANLAGSIFVNVICDGTDFTHAELSGVIFIAEKVATFNADEVDIEINTLNLALSTQQSLAAANICGFSKGKASLNKAILTGAVLNDALFMDVDCSFANFEQAQLMATTFERCDLDAT